MKTFFFLSILAFFGLTETIAQRTDRPQPDTLSGNHEFVLAFDSCNKVDVPNPFWAQIDSLDPDVFVWAGDNIYADTAAIDKMAAMYVEQNANPAYAKLKNDVPIMATWDDHDYGKNDAGSDFKGKK